MTNERGDVTTNDGDTVDLIRRWQTGDRRALGLILERHLEWITECVRRWLGPRLRSKAETGDLVQEVVVEIIESGPRFVVSNSEHFRALLARMARNVVCDQIDRFTALRRHVGRERPLPPDALVDLDPPRGSVRRPSEEAAQRESEAFMSLGLELLDADDRRVVLLRDIDELPFAEVAKRLGTTVGAATTRHRRAVARLKETVELLRDGRLADALSGDERESASRPKRRR
jgi:RNA polymerase sigma-70 factor, ECF subfamily